MMGNKFMPDLSKPGRIFYGIAIAGAGVQMICYRDLPYMLLPSKPSSPPGLAVLAVVLGVTFILAGVSIVFEKKTRQMSLLLAIVLLLIFCFGYIPYQFITDSNYMHLAKWENAEKELALAGGALIIAGCFSEKNENPFYGFSGKLIPFGPILFSITMISFGILHFLYTKEASAMVPAWIPNAMFCTYFAGVALIGSGIAIILKIRKRLIATLLGTMIFIWFIAIHIPRVLVSPVADRADEITSAFLALAYSAIAFVIPGPQKRH